MLADRIAALLARSPGLTAGQLADLLEAVPGAVPAGGVPGGVPGAVPGAVPGGERSVSFMLYASNDRFVCDSSDPPCWWLAARDQARRLVTVTGTAGSPARAPVTENAGTGTAGSPAGAPVTGAAGTGIAGSPAGAPATEAPAIEAPARAELRRMPARSVKLVPFSVLSETSLYAWQAEALAAWSAAGRRGVVEAVTGTGKTRVGIAAATYELASRGQVLVLVPTVELQSQWVEQLTSRLPESIAPGRLGAGAGDTLLTHDIVVAVVNTAREVDVRPIRRGGLLVADECHRYASAVNHLALDERFSARLGLSATYERDDGAHLALLDPYFGGTCFSLGYKRAVEDEVTAHFSVVLAGVRLEPDERCRYDELSKEMAVVRARLLDGFGLPPEPFDAFLRAVNQLAESGESGASLARRYKTAMLERRRLLAETPAKTDMLARLAPAMRSASRTIVFTQSIAASEWSCAVLRAEGLRAGVIHSVLSRAERRDVLGRFAAGEIDVISAPRILDEGIDVPAADLAVLVGASRSRRQMVQRMGRVLRRKPDGRSARFVVLYAEATVEDPARGAHEAFLGEITSVADAVLNVPATLASRPGFWQRRALAFSREQAPQPDARLVRWTGS